MSLINQAIPERNRTGPVSKPPKPVVSDPKACLAEAQQAMDKADLDNAKKLLQNLTSESVNRDDLWNTWTQLGGCFYEVGRYDDAVIAYQAAHDLIPDILISRFNLGLGLERAQKFEQALQAYKEADAAEPDHPKVWCNIGNVYFLIEDYNSAEAALKKTVALKPDYARAWDNLAAALGAQGKLEEAIQACLNAIQLRPNFPEAQFKLAVIYYSQQEFKKALSCIASASAQPSLTFYANAYLSMILSEMGNLVASERALTLAKESPGVVTETLSDAWRILGRARMKLMEMQRAVEALVEACKLNPYESQNWLDLGLAYQLSQNGAAAEKGFNKAMELEALKARATNTPG